MSRRDAVPPGGSSPLRSPARQERSPSVQSGPVGGGASADAEARHEAPPGLRDLWKQVLRVKELAKEDQVTLVAAGVGFYAFLALVPALVAAAAIYGLVSDPQQITEQVRSFAGALPSSTRNFLTTQLRTTSEVNGAEVSVAAGIAIAVALWSASAGTAALLRGLAVVNDAENARSYARRRGLALVVTLGAVVVVLIAVWLVSVLPPQLDRIGLASSWVRTAVEVLRWPVLAVVLALSVRGLYQLAAGSHTSRFITPGPIVASLLWLAASVLFSLYTANFSSLSRRYGSISSIIVVMLWLYLGALSVLLGAEVDAVVVADRQEGSGR